MHEIDYIDIYCFQCLSCSVSIGWQSFCALLCGVLYWRIWVLHYYCLQERKDISLGSGWQALQAVLSKPLPFSQVLPGPQNALLWCRTLPLLCYDYRGLRGMPHCRLLQQGRLAVFALFVFVCHFYHNTVLLHCRLDLMVCIFTKWLYIFCSGQF